MKLRPLAFSLTERQKQIGFCLLSGMSTKDIALRFNISTNTVREHQNLIRKKLSCDNPYQLGYQLGCFLKNEQEILNFRIETLIFEGGHPHISE